MIVQNVIRAILFVIMFSIGATALGGAILLDDLVRHYQSKHLLQQQRRFNDRLGELNDDYDALIRLLEEDPNAIRRIAPASVGADPIDPNAVYPKATARALAAARETLAEQVEIEPNEPPMPEWIHRVRKGDRRTILYVSGAMLVLISLVCFNPAKPPPDAAEDHQWHH